MQTEEKIVRLLKALISSDMMELGDDSLPEESLLHSKIEGMKSSPAFVAINFVGCTELEFANVDWKVVTRRLKEEVMVRYDQGSGIVDDSETYDKQWFSNLKLEKGGSEFYYSNRFSDYYAERLGPQVRYTISQDTQSILDLCGAPGREESRHIRGLVFGFVQSLPALFGFFLFLFLVLFSPCQRFVYPRRFLIAFHRKVFLLFSSV